MITYLARELSVLYLVPFNLHNLQKGAILRTGLYSSLITWPHVNSFLMWVVDSFQGMGDKIFQWNLLKRLSLMALLLSECGQD